MGEVEAVEAVQRGECGRNGAGEVVVREEEKLEARERGQIGYGAG